MEVLVLEGWSTERLFDGLEVRSCQGAVEVRRVVVGCEVGRQS
jgi:hypothetical protein